MDTYTHAHIHEEKNGEWNGEDNIGAALAEQNK